MTGCLSSFALALQLAAVTPETVRAEPGISAQIPCADAGLLLRDDHVVLTGGVRIRPFRIGDERPIWIRVGAEGEWRSDRRVIGGCQPTPDVKCPPKTIVEAIDAETGKIKKRFHVRPSVGFGADFRLGRDVFLSPHVELTNGGRLFLSLGIKL